MRDLIIGILGLIIFFSLVNNFSTSLADDRCSYQKTFSELQLNGVVINKYLDSTSHSVPTIIIKTKSSDSDSCILFFGERSNAFNSIQIGDTLEKSKKSNDIKVKYYGEKVYKVSFGCNEK